MTRWDAVVVGAGPAGSATAARLAGRGWRVLVLDRAHFPRRKPCGECVNPAGVAALHALGAWARIAALRPAPLEGWSIVSPGGDGFRGRFPDGAGGIALPREAMDHALLEHAAAAGAEVRTGVQVRELRREGGRVTSVVAAGGEAIAAGLVIGADGLRSVVARRLGLLRRAPRLRKVALTAHLDGVSGVAPGWGELRAFSGGCVGLAGVGGGAANVTLVVGDGSAPELSGDPDGFFDRALASHGVAGARTDAVLATGPFDYPMRAVTAEGALLVGDAAGYYDPFTGQGIFRALRGAELVEAALAEPGPTPAALAAYSRAYRAAFTPGERLQHLVEAFVSRPVWLGWAARRLSRRPELGDALIRATGDVTHPRTLLAPRLLARLAF